MAGTTLLAFSNGATDLVTALAASNAGSIDLVVGGLFGASTFAITVILASVALVSQQGALLDVIYYPVYFFHV